MDNMLHMPNQLMVPLNLLQWLVDYSVYGSGGVFKKKNKTIHFTKHIVDKVFGFESGTIPYVLESDDPDIISEVEALRLPYLKGNYISIEHLESILLGTNNEVVFMRYVMLYFISTLLCPSNYNFVNPKFSNIHEVIPKYMMMKAFEMFYSTLNEVKVQTFEMMKMCKG